MKRPYPLLKIFAVTFLALTAHGAPNTGTPFSGDAPDKHHPWAVHDRNRPQPPRVEPGTFSTASQPGNFGCFGLHEWAMVYRIDEVRHGKVAPLRLKQDEISALVESRPIRCSHYDAFRFFTPAASPLNQLQPTLEGRPQQEQPGCIHANMDLYKWAFKCQIWIPGELLLKSFSLAMELRKLDMRASPYDLSNYGYEPVRIETTEGTRDLLSEADRLGARLEAVLGTLDLTAEQDRIAGMIAAQIRAQGADMVAFTAARFTRPPFSLRGGLAAVQAAFGGEPGLAAFLRVLNAAVFDARPHQPDSPGEETRA
jgi:hypothetical protein